MAAIIPKQYEIGCQLLLITNRKSLYWYWLWMTLNGVLTFILRFLFHRIR